MNSLKICPDGSDRRFFRTSWNGRPAVVMEPAPGEQGRQEAEAFFLIGNHLYSMDVPVPEIYLFESATGRLVVEDLGDVRLQDQALRLLSEGNHSGLFNLYVKAIEVLILLQEQGTRGFDAAWCWQEPVYDSRLAMEREALYFLDAFIRGYAGITFAEEMLVEELAEITDLVDNHASGRLFMHRDFQSRNLMVRDGRVMVIDFQAARLGPPAYDLASLLHDPYVNMPWTMRQELYDIYRFDMRNMIPGKNSAMQLHLLSILRLLQALGAYGFLIMIRKRNFFAPFVKPALIGLERLLEGWQATECPELRRCVGAALSGLS